MLRRSFLQIQGIGPKTEQRLWREGITSWDQVVNGRLPSASLPQPSFPGFETAHPLKLRLSAGVKASQQALLQRDAAYFADTLPAPEWWRALEEFGDSAVFLDIETTGLSMVYDKLTVVGLYDGQEYGVFVRGHNLEEVTERLKGYSVIVTFNGSLFDLPFLRATFPNITLPPIHVDLRFLLRRLGYSGGLKRVEQELGIQRGEEVAGIDGRQAAVLWHRYTRGDTNSLKKLLLYNLDDTVNLQMLAQIAYQGLYARFFPGVAIHPASQSGFRPAFDADGVVAQLNSAPLDGAPENIVNSGPHRRRLLDNLIRGAGSPSRVVGIDLTGSEKRKSGWALVQGHSVETRRIASDDELIEATLAARPTLISIDSPLTLPGGVASAEQAAGIIRECERILRRRGVSVFWCLLPSMRTLTERGMRLAKRLRNAGVEVIESYPGAAQDILGIPRKKASLTELAEGLSGLGLEGELNKVSHDELDALTSALVGYFYLAGEYEGLGNEVEDYLIVPRLILEEEGSRSLDSCTEA